MYIYRCVCAKLFISLELRGMPFGELSSVHFFLMCTVCKNKCVCVF